MWRYASSLGQLGSTTSSRREPPNRGGPYKSSPNLWTPETDKRPRSSDDDINPAAKRTKTPILSDSTVDHRPHQDPRNTCYLLEGDCQYQDTVKFRRTYGPAYDKLCQNIVKGRDTCLLKTCLKNPLLPFSIIMSEAKKSWSPDGPPSSTNHI